MTSPSRVRPDQVSLRRIDSADEAPSITSTWDDWGDMDPAAAGMEIERWVIEVAAAPGAADVVGSLSAHAVYYGPTPGSRAMNIGISIREDRRGQGVGAIAQRLLAEELHRRGVVRVEASTDVENEAEQRALERAGFTYEGTLRRAQQRRDGLHDLQMWSCVQARD